MLNRAAAAMNAKHAALLVLIGLALAPAAAFTASGGETPAARGRGYTNLSVAVYFRYQEVQSTPNNLAQFATSWAKVEKQVKVDKVYLETTRNRQLATEAAVIAMKTFFQDRGIKVSAGLGLTVQESAGFQSFCYSTPADRDQVKAMTEFTARHFDEIILDDFYFTNCKCERCIAASRHDKDLVARTRNFVQAGGRAVATTGLIEALGDKGFQDIAEIEVTGHRVIARRFGGGSGGGRGATAAGAANEPDLNIVLPQMRHFENDAWPGLQFTTAASGYAMVISAAYGRGTFYVLAIPDDFADLYRLPQRVLNQIRSLLGRDMFVSLDAPDHVSLFAYDNRTFIVQNFRAQPVSTRVSVTGATRIRNLLTDQTLAGSRGTGGGGGWAGRGNFGGPSGASFEVMVPGHSFRVFAAE